MSELKENVVIYIAGYIRRKVISKVDCQMCKDYLYIEEALCTSKLIDRRDLGGLIKPNKELVDIVKIADTILEMKIKCSKDLFCERNLFKKLSIQALNSIHVSYDFMEKQNPWSYFQYLAMLLESWCNVLYPLFR